MSLHSPHPGVPAARRDLCLHRFILIALALGLMVVAGCGQKSTDPASSSLSSGGSSVTAVASTSKYDAGPRAGQSAADEALAEKGEQLFKDKGCSACHAFGKRVTGPDLQGVTMRRTAQWMENQILHPEVMTKEDPISHQLFAQFALQMPNQGLTPGEAKAVVEYFKHRDKETGEKKD